MDLKGKKITVVGLGRSGLSAARFLNKRGALVSITDSSENETVRKNLLKLERLILRSEIGTHTKDFVVGQDMIVASPGVTLDNPILVWARQLNVPVISEVELAAGFCKADVIAITGSNGKSTTTSLIGEIFKTANKDVIVCGNIGQPFCDYIDKIKKDSVVVLEISSAQLETVSEFRPRVSIILNITPNHLDRYASIEEYARFKARIFKNQSKNNFCILNFDDDYTRNLKDCCGCKVLFFSKMSKIEGVYSDNGFICVDLNGKPQKLCSTDNIGIKGSHNIYNSMAAILTAKVLGISDEYIIQALSNFEGLEHRIEYVETIDGVEFYNDSKSTTVDATIAALGMQTMPVVLIAGGKDKGADFTVIRNLIKDKVKMLVLIGKAKEKLAEQLSGATRIFKASSLNEAVELAFKQAQEKDIVLLSPMCASFDMFMDYEDRGRKFKEIVRDLKAKVNMVKGLRV